jgi:hypothetical protein
MDLNKKGQVVIVKMMIAIIILIVAVVLAKPLLDESNSARLNETGTGMNCTNPDINAVDNATCIVLDMGVFYLIGIILSASFAFMLGKKNVGGIVSAIMVFVIVSILLTPIKDFLVLVRNASNLNCAAAGITTGARMLCIFFDLWLFEFFVIAISLAISYIFIKKVVIRE